MGKAYIPTDRQERRVGRQARRVNQTSPVKVATAFRTYSLSGLAVCGHCGGPLHFQTTKHGRERVFCNEKGQVSGCGQRSSYFEPIDAALGTYLATFRVPKAMIIRLVAWSDLAPGERGDAEHRRRALETRLERIAELYTWGDLTREAYQAERAALAAELEGLSRDEAHLDALAETAAFLRDVPAAWAAADPDGRNEIARLLFASVSIKDDRVATVLVQPDYAPFFALDCQARADVSNERKRRDSNPRSQP